MMKKDYFVRSCIYNRICVVGKKETIYPLVEILRKLYLQLYTMHTVFTSDATNTLPTSEEISALQTEYKLALKVIIDMLDGAKYLWEGEHHE
jgi:ribose 5-phosphate isomerase